MFIQETPVLNILLALITLNRLKWAIIRFMNGEQIRSHFHAAIIGAVDETVLTL